MRFTALRVLLLATFVASVTSVTDHPDSTVNTNVETDRIDSENTVRRLRQHSVMGALPYAAMMNLMRRSDSMPSMSSTLSMQSSQILHAAENKQPLPKWAKALIVLLGLGITTGAVVGGIKVADLLINSAK